MPIHERPNQPQRIVRRVMSVRGADDVQARLLAGVQLRPHARTGSRVGPTGAVFSTPTLTLSLSSPVPLHDQNGGAQATFTLEQGEERTFVLEMAPDGTQVARTVTDEESQALFEATVAFWRSWLSACTYRGRWRETVRRSALVLKLLTYHPTGAIVAAPTASLPEGIGGVRNWDYRYTWIRDSAFTLYAFLRLGFSREAEAFMHFLSDRAREFEDGHRAAAPDHVRHRRPARPAGVRARPPRGLHGLAAGADRQRRRRPAAARHLRRADRLDLPLQQVRRADLVRPLEGDRQAARVPDRALAASRTRASGRCAAASRSSPTRA